MIRKTWIFRKKIIGRINRLPKWRRRLLILFADLFLLLLLLRLSPYPSLNKFLRHKISTRVYDGSGELIQVIPLEEGLRREFIPLEKIPPELCGIIIASEDRNFYRHFGIDIPAILRAASQNISSRRTVSGASTITMQLSRMIYPRKSRNIFYKILEALDALRLEARLSKEQILELYLNNISFGSNTEGLASASRYFFGRSVERLSTEQMYCLAVIPRRPQSYSPLKDIHRNAAAAFELYSKKNKNSNNKNISLLSYEDFASAAKTACAFEYPKEMPHYIRYLSSIKKSGIYSKDEIHLAARLKLQRTAQRLLREAVQENRSKRITNGAILIIENRTGNILAWVGSADFFDTGAKGQVDGVLTPEQPGSSMKPFLYALALEKGRTPASILPDTPLDFGSEKLYAPQNFNNRFSGPVRLRVALASSLNVPAVYLLNEIGLDEYLSRLNELGFKSLKGKNPGLSLALGGAEVSLFELVQAFSVFTRDGDFIPIAPAPDASPACKEKKVYDTDSARLICDILSDKNARAMGFGFTKNFETPFDSIFKTGTANQFQNITALGASSLYTVGVWMGNFDGETIIGKTGSSLPARIARQLLTMTQGKRETHFDKPLQYHKARICTISGMAANSNCHDTLDEYIPDSKPLKNCSWHTKEQTLYPAEYQRWFYLKERTGSLDESDSALKIITPREGSVFYFDSSQSPFSKKFLVEACGGGLDTAKIILDRNEDSAFIIERPFSFWVELMPGTSPQNRHSVEIICGDEAQTLNYIVK